MRRKVAEPDEAARIFRLDHAEGTEWPMGRTLLDCSDDCDPDTVKLLSRAFDAAWKDIGNNDLEAAGEDRRIRLGLIVLALAHNGTRDEAEIKEAAIKVIDHNAMLAGGQRFTAVSHREVTLDEAEPVKSRGNRDSGACDGSVHRVFRAPVHGHASRRVAVHSFGDRWELMRRGAQYSFYPGGQAATACGRMEATASWRSPARRQNTGCNSRSATTSVFSLSRR